MTALTRKLLRDLRRGWPQVLSIASVIAAGIGGMVCLRSTIDGLDRARLRLYRQTGFADAEAHLERAPEAVLRRLDAVPGVRRAEPRLVQAVTIPRPEDPLPPFGTLVSLPPPAPTALNRVVLLRGRLPEAPGEALLLARFAARYRVAPGDALTFVTRGSRRTVRVTGLATSAEFVYPTASGSNLAGEDDRFAVLWMPRPHLEALLGFEGAFNDVLLSLDPAVPWPAVRAEVDRVLAPHGGLGLVERAHQPSEDILRGELRQLRSLATVLPAIFLAIAAFLVNVVISRLVVLQRPEIAALRALGYTGREVAWHLAQFVGAIALLGAVAGIALGTVLGDALIGLYAEFFHLPRLGVRLAPGLVALSLGAGLAAGAFGAARALVQVLRLLPADAMRPPAPARYRKLLIDRLPALAGIAPTARMVARELERQPIHALVAIAGVAAGVGILVLGRFNMDAVDRLIALQFQLASRESMSVGLRAPVPREALGTMARLPGVLRAEGFRAAPVRLVAGARRRDVPLLAYDAGATLRRAVDQSGRVRAMPAQGLLLTGTLAERLGLRPGDSVRVEFREGRWPVRTLVVADTIAETVGLQAYADPAMLARWLGEAPAYSGFVLQTDPALAPALARRLSDMAMVTGYTTRAALVRRFRDQMRRTAGTMGVITSVFAMVIAAGIVYNGARVALSTRGRDLATLRVLGFTRAEVTRMLLGEQAVSVLLGLPLGLVIGRGFREVVVRSLDVEQVRLPAETSPATDAFGMLVVLATAVASGLLVARRIGRLDLIAVLKTRE